MARGRSTKKQQTINRGFRQIQEAWNYLEELTGKQKLRPKLPKNYTASTLKTQRKHYQEAKKLAKKAGFEIPSINTIWKARTSEPTQAYQSQDRDINMRTETPKDKDPNKDYIENVIRTMRSMKLRDRSNWNGKDDYDKYFTKYVNPYLDTYESQIRWYVSKYGNKAVADAFANNNYVAKFLEASQYYLDKIQEFVQGDGGLDEYFRDVFQEAMSNFEKELDEE